MKYRIQSWLKVAVTSCMLSIQIVCKLEDLNGFLKENKSKIGGFPLIGRRMESMFIIIGVMCSEFDNFCKIG